LSTAPIVIKVGGNELNCEGFIEQLARTVASIAARQPCILVHGGGRTVDDLLDRLGIEPEYVDGQRVTDEAVLDVVAMVLSGQVNKELVFALQQSGVDALGVSGVDRGLLCAEQWSPALGRVGRITRVRAGVLLGWCAESVVPVISPVSAGLDGRYNVNADHAAGAVAAAVNASSAVFVSNVPGVCIGDIAVPQLTAREIEALITDGTISGGMIPKVRAALDALNSGVAAVVVTDLAGLAAGSGTHIIPS
jgi:acetylglutamate kinase